MLVAAVVMAIVVLARLPRALVRRSALSRRLLCCPSRRSGGGGDIAKRRIRTAREARRVGALALLRDRRPDDGCAPSRAVGPSPQVWRLLCCSDQRTTRNCKEKFPLPMSGRRQSADVARTLENVRRDEKCRATSRVTADR